MHRIIIPHPDCNLLLIANGRTGDDKNVGNFTYVSPIGNSVTDYVICSNELMDDIKRFCIGERTESSHFPISFSINSTIIPAVNENNTETDIKYETNTKYHVFNDIKIEQYIESLLGSLPDESVQQMWAKNYDNNTNINEILKDFQNILKTSSNMCLRHKKFSKRSQPKWFDKDCK